MYYVVDLLGQIHTFGCGDRHATRLTEAGFFTTKSYFEAVCYAKSIILRGSNAKTHKAYFINNL